MPNPNDTTNNNSPDVTDETPETEQPSYLTSEQFNKAISARERAFEKKLAKQQEEFQKMLERFAPPPKEEPQLSRTAELEKTVKELSKTLQDRDARDRDAALRKAAEQSLKQHGFDPEFIDHATSYLVDAKKAIRYNNDGELVMVLNGMEYDDLDEGMTVFAQSRDAKLYKKASGAQGSGSSPMKSAIDQLKTTGQIDIKHKQDWFKSNETNGKKALTLTPDSKVALQQALVQKLLKR